jgi:uncharacterized protein (DUF4415 family)
MTAKKHAIGSDLAKVDAHEIQPEEYAEIPELTDEELDRAELWIGNKFVPKKRGPGRPPAEHPKEQVTLRLDADVIAHFRAGGPGWQTRVNAALRDFLSPRVKPEGQRKRARGRAPQ